VAAAAFGPESDDVWTNAPPLAGWARAAMARRALRAVRAGEAPVAATPIGQDPRPPAVTYGLLALLAAVYLLQLTLGEWRGLLTPTGRSLLAMGALQRGLVVEAGQWYRVAAATLLHGSPVHLLLNGVALFLGGRLLEPMIGRGWFAAVYGLSALGGSLGSMLLNPAGTVSVGASGAIVGLFGAALAVSHRMPYGAARAWARTLVLQVLLPSVLPILLPTGSGIDFAGHLGGAVIGLLVGVFLVARWPRTEPHPRDRRLGAALAVGCGLVLGAGLARAIALEPALARALSIFP
jgi:rhomboid protease GluP